MGCFYRYRRNGIRHVEECHEFEIARARRDKKKENRKKSVNKRSVSEVIIYRIFYLFIYDEKQCSIYYLRFSFSLPKFQIYSMIYGYLFINIG